MEKLWLKVLMNYLLKFLRSLGILPKIELVHAVLCFTWVPSAIFYIYTYIHRHTYISLHTQRKKKNQPSICKWGFASCVFCEFCVASLCYLRKVMFNRMLLWFIAYDYSSLNFRAQFLLNSLSPLPFLSHSLSLPPNLDFFFCFLFNALFLLLLHLFTIPL